MFKLEVIELVSWTASIASVEGTYERSGEVCGTGNERRPRNVLVAIKSKSIDICGRIAPRRIERRAGDGHHSHRLVTLPKSNSSLLQRSFNRKEGNERYCG
jgi:hypothetical protein